MPLLTEIPYRPNSVELFDAIVDRPWAVFLDSGYPGTHHGRYDVLSANPMITLITRGNLTEVRTAGGTVLSPEDPLRLLRRYLEPTEAPLQGVPFAGGAIGYFAYDLARRWERLPRLSADTERLPEMMVGLYDWALVVDHHERRSLLVGRGRDRRTLESWDCLADTFRSPVVRLERTPFRVTGKVHANLDREEYAQRFQRIQRYIRDGDCYQVNLAQRFSATTAGDPWRAYQMLREINSAPFAAFLNLPAAQILSFSPERFLRVRGGMVETKPIKGTRPRSPDRAADQALAAALQSSAKDRAENLMIVDLLRNDLSKNCALGSVRVPVLFELESFASVHHLVSRVCGRLAGGRHPLDLLRGCFPGGSITGAPKLRAMEVIEELEPHRREVYCGALGYVGFDASMDTSIAIRTLVHASSRMHFSAGGGIVADSELEAEYQECYDKAAPMLALLRQRDLRDVGS